MRIRRSTTAAIAAALTLLSACGDQATEPSSGELHIVVATKGDDLDPDGYALGVDQGSPVTLPANGETSVTGMAPGAHAVKLLGVASNCAVDGSNPRDVMVVAGDTVRVDFVVKCVPAPPAFGIVEITTTTEGSPGDPDGYRLFLDSPLEDSFYRIGNNATTRIDLPTGTHSVILADVASNCRVSNGNPRTVTILANQTRAIEFDVVCSGESGGVLVVRTITGDHTVPLGDIVAQRGDWLPTARRTVHPVDTR